jgi:hypothetical protein
VKIKLQQASDTKFFHIGFYIAKVDPGTLNSSLLAVSHLQPALESRRQLQLCKDQFVGKAGFDAKKEGTVLRRIQRLTLVQCWPTWCSSRPTSTSSSPVLFIRMRWAH